MSCHHYPCSTGDSLKDPILGEREIENGDGRSHGGSSV
jgi:hypothetical protein